MHASFAQCKHARFRADGLGFSTAGALHLIGNLLQIDTAHQIHLARMNLEQNNIHAHRKQK
jgi:hypothetical protein